MKRRTTQGCILTFLAAIALGGCATTGTTNGSGRSDLLTREQIMSVQGATNLYDVVQRLRPRWLVVRAENRSIGGMVTGIVVYQGQTQLGNADVLRQLQPGMAFELKYLDGTTASTTLPGISPGVHVAGAIVMSTRDPNGKGM